MPETKLPGTKTKVKNKWLWIGGGIGGVALILFIRKRKQNQQAANTAGGSNIDPNTGMPMDSGSGIDPNTGVPYSQEAIDPNTGVPFADESGGFGGGGFLGGPSGIPSGGGGTVNVTQTVTTNAEWAQASEQYLTSIGYNGMSVALALGKYLSGQGLTNDQFNIVEAAIGFEGTPPTSVPPPHRIAPKGGQDGGNRRRHIITIRANGREDLQHIAADHEMRERQLVMLNPTLAYLVGSGKPVREGTRVRVYAGT